MSKFMLPAVMAMSAAMFTLTDAEAKGGKGNQQQNQNKPQWNQQNFNKPQWNKPKPNWQKPNWQKPIVNKPKPNKPQPNWQKPVNGFVNKPGNGGGGGAWKPNKPAWKPGKKPIIIVFNPRPRPRPQYNVITVPVYQPVYQPVEAIDEVAPSAPEGEEVAEQPAQTSPVVITNTTSEAMSFEFYNGEAWEAAEIPAGQQVEMQVAESLQVRYVVNSEYKEYTLAGGTTNKFQADEEGVTNLFGE